MSARYVADLASGELRKLGISIALRPREGTWTEPAMIEFDVDEKHHALPFWLDPDKQRTLKTAECIFDDVLRAVGRPELIPDRSDER